jgi:hypothetical protein
MKTTKNILISMILLSLTSLGYTQKGTGNTSGIAKSDLVNEIENVSGELQQIITEPCTQTTGRYSEGSHLLIKTNQERTSTLNLHLGPTRVISGMTNQLKTGQGIKVKVFSTKVMPANHYIVKEFQSNGESYEIRDSDLRPFWAGKRGNRSGKKQRR